MRPTRPTMQELIRQRRRAGFVGRNDERAAFRRNFDLAPEDERHRFLFHVHGNAGVGKTFLVRELEQLAREKGALTAYVDEGAGSIPEAMTAISRQFGAQGHRFKELNRVLADHRERRYEAEAAVLALDPGPEEPSTGSVAMARAGLAGLGLMPGVGAVAGALDPAQLAQGVDRLRAGISARLRNSEDVQLLLSPERVLTPVLLGELAEAATAAPWIVLFFDTYERTGPFLDGWLHEVMTTDRHGALPATVVVVTAGQLPFDTARWGAFADFMTDVPLGPFTEAEARGLLADKGVLAAPVVEEVLRLTGGLPVLVSTLAEQRPADPDDVGDPSATAVERFLKWVQDPARRAAALACALPRKLDADVFRAVVRGETDDTLYEWLRSLPFVSERSDHLRYHDVVRAPMLRLQRKRSPRGWAEEQRRLAGVFGAWRAEAEAGRGDARLWSDDEQRLAGVFPSWRAQTETDGLWPDERWRELRLAETYHLLCAGERDALPGALRDFVAACDLGDTAAVTWARTVEDAGRDGGVAEVARWGSELTGALADGGVPEALGHLLRGTSLDLAEQARARTVMGSALRDAGAHQEALAEYGRALALDPGLARAHRGRSTVRAELGDYDGAVADLGKALEIAPDNALWWAVRGEYHRIRGWDTEALRDLDRSLTLDPSLDFAWASRGATRLRQGDPDTALPDLDRALELNPDYAWALARRARVWRALGDPERQLADLDRALTVDPDWAWGLCERGDALRAAGRAEESLTDLDRALTLAPAYTSARASRGATLAALGRHREALADLDAVLTDSPTYTWALLQRAAVHRALGAPEKATTDEETAARLSTDGAS
ncbi:tetratricopeptide repeat protein [Streptomyces sp. NPDC050803]|uniref:tetratricopeptide repeat protein n=1 Tax=unclassified Streptomyces TaxID=2593676 RepID=UPI003445139F